MPIQPMETSSPLIPRESAAVQSVTLFYITTELRRRVSSFLIGIFTVFICVFFISLLLNLVVKSPFIFLRLSEESTGEGDILISPDISAARIAAETEEANANQIVVVTLNDTNITSTRQSRDISEFFPPIDRILLNQTLIAATIDGSRTGDVQIEGSSPRWTLPIELNASSTNATAKGFIIAGDMRKERKIALGRKFRTVDPIGTHQCYLSRSLTRLLLLDPKTATGEEIFILFEPKFILKSLGWPSTPQEFAVRLIDFVVESSEAIDENGNLVIDVFGFPVSVANVYTRGVETLAAILNPLFSTVEYAATVEYVAEKPDGKWPSAFGNIIMIDGPLVFEDISAIIAQRIDIFRNNVTDQPENATVVDIILDIAFSNRNLTQNETNFRDFLEENNKVISEFLGTSFNVTFESFNASINQILDGIDQIDFENYAFASYVQYYERFSTYIQNARGIKEGMIALSNHVMLRLGINQPYDLTTPLADALGASSFLRIFLDNILAFVIAIMCILSVILIYSLLLGDIEEQTFEYGMLRALGLPNKSLVNLLLLKSLIFSVFGILFGLMVAFLCNVPVTKLISDYLLLSLVENGTLSIYLSSNAVISGIVFGILLPILANVAPISRALSTNLRDSLDIYHSVVAETTIKIIKLSELGLSLTQTIMATFLVVIGFITFFIIPYAFTFNNFGLFLGVLNTILMGMLLGLSLLASALQPILEGLILRLILRLNFRHRKLQDIIQKNLNGHRMRNQKTSMMFTIGLAFVIFAGSMVTLQKDAVVTAVQATIGADIVVMANSLREPLIETEYRNLFAKNKQNGLWADIVKDFSFTTFALKDLSNVGTTRFSRLINEREISAPIFGIEDNFLDVSYSKFFVVTEKNAKVSMPQIAQSKLGPVNPFSSDIAPFNHSEAENRYIPNQSVVSRTNQSNPAAGREYIEQRYSTRYDVIVSEGLREYAEFDTTQPLLLSYSVTASNEQYKVSTVLKRFCRVLVMARKMPGFFFSAYQFTATASPMLVPMHHFVQMIYDANAFMVKEYNISMHTTESNDEAQIKAEILAEIPKRTLLVELFPGVSKDQREDVVDSLSTFFESDLTQAFDVRTLNETAETSVSILVLVFNIIGLMAVFLCFLVLILSFTANVRENSWELGVLRAVGLNTTQTIMLYIYEALSLVLASIILGTGIGLGIAISLTLQFNLFLELPFNFAFPWGLFLSIVVVGCATAVLGSYFPAKRMLKSPITEIISGRAE